MLRRHLLAALAALPLLAGPLAPQAAAQELIVEKKSFEIPRFVTQNGQPIPALRIGYQTAGTLNGAGDNAVLVAHFFSGNSHAFGRYTAGGPPGYWDAIIGPGRPIDTNKYFVIAADTPLNINTRDPNTITTGPATTNPETGRPWGMGFPVMTIRDFVETQKKLLDSLGVRRLALVAGASMGALQTIEWAAAYPDMVQRAMSVIGTDRVDGWIIGWLELWAAPIRLDPAWNAGRYHGSTTEPVAGLAESLKLVTLHARDHPWATALGTRFAEGQDPRRSVTERFAMEKWLDDAAMARARVSDANHFLYLIRANQLFLSGYDSPEAALSRSRAKWLIVPSVSDRVFPIEYNRRLAETLRQQGREVDVVDLEGPLGHLEGVVSMAKAGDAIRRLLAN
ncbi:homoserine O-acetyltransferase [Elioraea sp.]|uniref:E22 family MetX-like putative esterase n=1 Tax=Elioraea sp. TaxID=2185103 RepID=UPI0025BFF1CC|nr:homoserine O-acetyltransferase [Elioraea sp.]